MDDVQEANWNPLCGGFIVGVLRAARSWRRRPAGLGFAIRDCACKPYKPWRYPAAAIVAAAIIDVIRLRTANSVS
jgi:hypothetical protein